MLCSYASVICLAGIVFGPADRQEDAIPHLMLIRLSKAGHVSCGSNKVVSSIFDLEQIAVTLFPAAVMFKA